METHEIETVETPEVVTMLGHLAVSPESHYSDTADNYGQYPYTD